MTTKISPIAWLIPALLVGTALTLAAAPTPTPPPNTSLPYTFYDRYGSGSQTPTPTPKHKIGDSSNPSQKTHSKTSSTSTEWKKTADDAQGRFSVDFGGSNSSAPQTQTSDTSKVTKKPDTDEAQTFDNVLIGDYQQGASSTSKSNPKAHAGVTADKTYDGAPILYTRATPTPSAKANESSSNDTNDQHGKHNKKKKKHHHH